MLQLVVWVWEFILFLIRGTCIAIADFYMMYTRIGLVWWHRRQQRPPSMEKGDLVMQLAPQSPHHSRVNAMDELLHLNESFIDRQLWAGMSASSVPSAVVTGVSYGGIGFYTALNLLACGMNVHGVVPTPKDAQLAERMMQLAIERQSKLHKDWAGRTGRMMIHLCDISDTTAVSRLADTLQSDSQLRVIICGAGPMASPPRLSRQGLEEQFATHHVGHSLLTLRLLQHRQRSHGPISTSRWRIVFLASGAAATANPTMESTFKQWTSVDALTEHFSRFAGYGNAKMCELLFSFALARYVQRERRLAPYCTVNVLHPGPIRSRVIPNSELPLQWLLDGELAALFRMTPVIASLFVTDLALARRHEHINGHFFRMGEDEMVYAADVVRDPVRRSGFVRNSTLYPGIPGPAVALSVDKQEWLWSATLDFFEKLKLIDTRGFR